MIARHVVSLGNLPFDKFRGFSSMVRTSDKPYRFVDGELIEQFLNCEPRVQAEIVESVAEVGVDAGLTGVEEVKGMIEALRRLH